MSDVFIDRTTYCGGWRAARSVPAGDTGVKADPVYVIARPIARLARAMRTDGALGEWDKPFAVLNTRESVTPKSLAHPSTTGKTGATNEVPLKGPSDLSAKVYLGWDGEALCVAAEVNDDKHFNPYALQDVERGDCLTLDLRTPQGNGHIVLALTQTGVAFHQGEAPNEELAKTAGVAVARDDAGGLTRYELRFPLAVSGQEPGIEFDIRAAVVDADDDSGQNRVIQMCTANPVRTSAEVRANVPCRPAMRSAGSSRAPTGAAPRTCPGTGRRRTLSAPACGSVPGGSATA